jgi:hypothetical protein
MIYTPSIARDWCFPALECILFEVPDYLSVCACFSPRIALSGGGRGYVDHFWTRFCLVVPCERCFTCWERNKAGQPLRFPGFNHS